MIPPPYGILSWSLRKTPLHVGDPLRVGVAVDGGSKIPWIDSLLEFLRQTPGLDVQVFSLAASGGAAAKNTSWLVDRLYSASRKRFDPFGAIGCGAHREASAESMDALRASGFEVILWLSDCTSAAVRGGMARYGAFSVRLGEGKWAIPFWGEVASGQVTADTTIFWHDESLTVGREVGNAETATARGMFVTPTAEQPLAAVMRMLAALCAEIQQDGLRFLARVQALPTVNVTSKAEFECPSSLAAAQFIAAKSMRSAHLRWSTRGKKAQWFVAMRPNRGESIASGSDFATAGFTDVPLPAGVAAMADPFLVEAHGTQYLLFEEIAKGQNRGRLGCVEVMADGTVSEMQILLDRPYHLSYPCVATHKRELFMLPETSEANRVDLYRFTRFPGAVELVASPLEGVALVDTTPVCIDGHWYFFTTTIEPFMESVLFEAVRLEGPWNLHPCSPVSRSVRNSRSAGHLFWKDGRLFRPTQDCSVRYGYAIVLNEVVRLTPTEFEERKVGYLPPTWAPRLLGTHTWNESPAFQVLDGIRYV